MMMVKMAAGNHNDLISAMLVRLASARQIAPHIVPIVADLKLLQA
jgi:hypothetical protein